uniref:DOMON domain-containing protein n=1 Tax=Amphimedon queenslandica TaxID=400682 RepID=A0A1X7UJB8_AMPQE
MQIKEFCLFFFLPLIVSCIKDLTSIYPFNVALDQDNYWLYWNFSKTSEVIKFAVKVQTTGWIGFGLSSNGQMPGSDVVIGWVDGSSKYFHDRYAYGRYTPPIDPIQNWFLTNAEVEDGYTVLEFYRNFITCDDCDLDILYETAHVVYSWSNKKPTVTKEADGSITYTISKHNNQGTRSFNLLGALPNPPRIPDNTQSFTVSASQVDVPSVTTTYWCEAMKLSPALTYNMKYIIKFSPHITPGNEPFVHHIVIYLCDGLYESDLGAEGSGECYGGVSDRVADCAIPFAVWGVGGSDFTFPSNIAYPIGGAKSPHYAVIQLHYNNPDHISGIVDSSGIEFTYIDTPREYNAGVMTVGHINDNTMVIPPNTVDYSVTGLCPSECTRNFLPPNGVKVFANMFHTHTAGSKLIIHHIRQLECSPGISRYEELSPIDKNYHYDFNFQQFNHLKKEITVLPGDSLMLECYYNTSNRNKITMVRQYVSYITQSLLLSQGERADCESTPTFDQFKIFVEQHVPSEYRNLFGSLSANSSREKMETAMNLLDWTPEQKESYRKLIYKNGKQSTRCLPPETGKTIISTVPQVCCSYTSLQSCNNEEQVLPCCKRECVQEVSRGSAGASSSDIQIIILIMLTAITLFLLVLVTIFWPQISHRYLT